MELITEFLQLAESNIWLKLIVGVLLLVISFVSLIISIKKNKVLSNSEISKQVSYVSKAMSMIVPAITILLEQKKGNESHEEKSDQ